MPELPEVETIAANLRHGAFGYPSLVSCRIESAQVYWPRTLANLTPDQFVSRLSGQAIQAIYRRGKFLVFSLSTDQLILHLRMSGDLLLRPLSAPNEKHDRLRLDLENGFYLVFNDPRKFGRVWLTDHPQGVLGDLGPEPLDDTFTPEELFRRLVSRRRQLKPLLLDQRFLAGLGNIYADEALHMAGLHPLKLANTLTPQQAEALWRSIREVLQESILRNGSSIDWVYRGGEFQNYFRVYQRTGEPCRSCGTPIERIVIGQRSTHFCPRCQPR